MTEHGISHFNVRVYGLLENEIGQVLLSTENLDGQIFTKFPGGGLEYGESTRDCLAREFTEECDIELVVGEHLYTTDFFQRSVFNQAHQVLAIYYRCSSANWNSIRLDEHPLPDSPHPNHSICFFWVDKAALNADMLTFPIDRVAVAEYAAFSK